MVFITGDTHGDFRRIVEYLEQRKTKKEDLFIILGDVGLNYRETEMEKENKRRLAACNITFFCIHGNHEKRPARIKTYEIQEFRGGRVYVEKEYPNLLFAIDGEVYHFEGKETLVIGGAYSVDKFYRLKKGYAWWEDEQPSEEIKKYVEEQCERRKWKLDVVLSHTCPFSYLPREVFLGEIDPSIVDDSTERFLDRIERRLDYQKWYCGHFHTNKEIEKLEFLFEEIKTWKED